tara:strand:- start:18 stop:944 length:927 start_codon:yes stop_codon:yes gene_type:complete
MIEGIELKKCGKVVECFDIKNPVSHAYDWYELRDYWNNSPLSHIFNKSYLKDNYEGSDIGCMACGQNQDNKYNGQLERAHILSLCIKGSNLMSNLHALCKTCHKESEEKYGLYYWMWLYNKAKVYTHGYFMTTEIDDGQLYEYKGEFGTKLQERATEIKNYFILKEFSTPINYPIYSIDEEIKIFTLSLTALMFSGLTDDDIKHILEICEYSTILSTTNKTLPDVWLRKKKVKAKVKAKKVVKKYYTTYEYSCVYCNAQFKRKQNYERHTISTKCYNIMMKDESLSEGDKYDLISKWEMKRWTESNDI